MKLGVIIIALFLVACEDEWTGIDDYIKKSCVDEKHDRYVMYLSDRWGNSYHETIAGAVDTVNGTFDVNIQICGIVEGVGHEEGHVIAEMTGDYSAQRSGRTVARATKYKIYVWLERIRHKDHLYKVLLHEFGHYLYCRWGHIKGKENIMLQGWWGTMDYSEADIDFIESGGGCE